MFLSSSVLFTFFLLSEYTRDREEKSQNDGRKEREAKKKGYFHILNERCTWCDFFFFFLTLRANDYQHIANDLLSLSLSLFLYLCKLYWSLGE